jgi:hypothetical protein
MATRNLSALMFLSLCDLGCGHPPLFGESCEVEIKAYSGFGDQVEFKILKLVHSESKVDLLRHPEIVDFFPNNKSILRFKLPTYAFRGTFDLQLELRGQKAESIGLKRQTHTISIGGCPQRVTLVVSGLMGPEDSVGTRVIGSVKGCKFDGDWWVKLYPMFGTEKTDAAVEGTIQANGSFSATGYMGGQRSLLIVGRGKDPLKMVALDIYTGKTNVVNPLDLSSVCAGK